MTSPRKTIPLHSAHVALRVTAAPEPSAGASPGAQADQDVRSARDGGEGLPGTAGPSCREACQANEPVALSMHELAESLGAAIDAKDRFTRAHSDEVAVIAEKLALRLGFSRAEAAIVHVAGHLHDIGKIGLPDSVLQKPCALSSEEWALVRRHPAMGHDILAPVGCLCAAGVPMMVLHHHERFDGGGYPRGLSGQGIPFGARIIAVADSLSAMLQARAYRAPMSFEDAMAEVRRCAGGQFDPRVVGALMDMADEACAALTACREALAAQMKAG